MVIYISKIYVRLRDNNTEKSFGKVLAVCFYNLFLPIKKSQGDEPEVLFWIKENRLKRKISIWRFKYLLVQGTKYLIGIPGFQLFIFPEFFY